MSTLHLIGWIAIAGAATVLVAFVAADAVQYLLRARQIARISREGDATGAPAPRVAGATPGREAGVSAPPGAHVRPRYPGVFARHPAPSGTTADGRK